MLRSFDEMLSSRLMDAMHADGIEIVTDAHAAALERDAAGLRLSLADGRAFGPFDCVLWAIGRRPLTAGLGLEAAGVALGPGGAIVTDLKQDTNVAGLHAIGDVTGRSELTPVAIAAGRRLADRLFGGAAGSPPRLSAGPDGRLQPPADRHRRASPRPRRARRTATASRCSATISCRSTTASRRAAGAPR